MTARTPGAARAQSSRLPPTVLGLGVVSLLTDASSEAIFPLLPAFLVSLGASGAFIGLVEGAAELVASVLKVVTGVVADRRARLKPLVLAGYGLSTAIRPLVAFALAPWHVLAVRVLDRVGKGVRTSPRDALIAGVTAPSIRARAFGFHRAMDHAGAVLGTLLGAGLLWLLGAREGATPADAERMRTVFLWAAVPGALALAALVFTPEPPHGRARPEPAEEPPAGVPSSARPEPVEGRASADRDRSCFDKLSTSGERSVRPLTLSLSKGEPVEGRAVACALPQPLRRALLALTVFAFANATDAFLLVKAARLGASPALAPLLWLTLHLVKAATATAGGRLADRHGRRNALVLGWCVYAVVWGAIGFASSLPVLFALTAAYGVTHGLVEGAERALVAELAVEGRRGTAFGAYNLAIGVAALVAGVAFGAAWDRFGSAAAFAGSGAVALAAAAALWVLVPGRTHS